MRNAMAVILALSLILPAACNGGNGEECEPGQIRLPDGSCMWPSDTDTDVQPDAPDVDVPDDVPSEGDDDGDVPTDFPMDGDLPPCDNPCEAHEDCDDEDPCTTDQCSPVTQCCVHWTDDTDYEPCGDEIYCNGADYCLSGVCTHEDIECVSTDVCTIVECDEVNQTCSLSNLPNGTSCDDGLYCTGPDNICQDGACQYFDPCPTFTGNACTVYVCYEATPHCVESDLPDGTSCPDADPCNGNERCVDGACSFVEPSCWDGDPCTDDVCQPSTGTCTNPAVSGCTPCDPAANCDDDDPCTTDTCRDVSGTITCEHFPLIDCV